MDYEHDYYSDQCADCKWAEWRGGCLNKAGASDGSDTLDAAEEGECALFEAGAPQGRQPHPGERLSVVVPLDDYSSLRARAEAAEVALAAARVEAAQARAEGEAAGATRERAAVVAMLLLSPDPVWGEVARCIMDGEHVAPAAGGAR